MKHYARLLGSFGYSSHNLLDSYTGFVVISWEIVNGADASSNPAAIRAVHAQLDRAMRATPDVMALSADMKQDTSEVLSYQAMLAGSAKNDLVKQGDVAGLRTLRSNVATMASQMGVDVRGLRLTEDGLRPAN